MWKERIRSWIPNSFTFGNLFCGVVAIVYAARGDFSNATLLIIIAMMLMIAETLIFLFAQ